MNEKILCPYALRQRDKHWLVCTKLRQNGKRDTDSACIHVWRCNSDMVLYNNEYYQNCKYGRDTDMAAQAQKVSNPIDNEPKMAYNVVDNSINVDTIEADNDSDDAEVVVPKYEYKSAKRNKGRFVRNVVEPERTEN